MNTSEKRTDCRQTPVRRQNQTITKEPPALSLSAALWTIWPDEIINLTASSGIAASHPGPGPPAFSGRCGLSHRRQWSACFQ